MLPVSFYLFTNVSNVQKDQEYLAQAVSRAEEDIKTLETTVTTIKDTVSELDKAITVNQTRNQHLIEQNGEGIERLQKTLNQILELMAKKG